MSDASSATIQLAQQLVTDNDYIRQLEHYKCLALHEESVARSGIVLSQSIPPEGENEDEEVSDVPNIPLANLSFVAVINVQQCCLGELINFFLLCLI